MKSLTVRAKFFIPVGATLVVVIAVASWLFVTQQSSQAEAAFRGNLETIAVTSCLMMHGSAEEYAEAHGLRFHRVLAGSAAGGGDAERIAREAIGMLGADTKLAWVERRGMDTSGATVLYVFAPARIKDECANCHSAYGMDTFKDRATGDLVAAFGVSGSLEDLEKQQAQFILVACLAGFAVLVATSVIIILISNSVIVRPLKTLCTFSSAIAAGDLTAEVEVRSQDEIARLGESFNGMVRQLRTTIGSVESAADAVASAGSEISASSEEMASGAGEQSRQADNVAAAVEQMSKTIVENARSAGQASAAAAGAKESAERGGTVVSRTVEGMRRIAGVVRDSARAVEELGKSGERIGEITRVIDDIADQTNLLALNAAIEAARVGDAGRGFAVVADEVRKLADRTSGATREISQMIREIQSRTNEAVAVINSGTKEVDTGIVLADEAGQALVDIVEKAGHLTGMVARISIASDEQAKASEQIAANVEGITRVAGESTQATEQIAHAAEDLTHLTHNLQELVGRFRLRQETLRQLPTSHSLRPANLQETVLSEQ
jgi:methyl-accepting chemotaxis protein